MTSETYEDRAPVGFPSGHKFVLTTSWDDGHPLDLRIAELLAEYQLKGTFYVPCQNGHELLSAAQTRGIAETFEVGAHTVHHVDLTSVTDSVARQEISESKNRIEQVTGKSCPTFCFPLGHFASCHIDMVREAGFTAARTVELLSLDQPRRTNGLAVLPTTVQAYPHAKLSYWKNFAKRFRVNNVPMLFTIGAAKDWVAAAISLLTLARERGGVFHLWGHSWEIDESGEWENLARVFEAMREMKDYAVCVSNSELCHTAS